MAKRSIQGYVELASGLGELTRSRAKEAAQELLTLTGADATSKKVAQQASQLADELLTAAETNRRHLVSLIRREVESAMNRLDVSRLLGDVQNLRATVAALAGQVDELARAASGRGSLVSPPSRSDAVPSPSPVPVMSDTSAATGRVTASATTTSAPVKSAPAPSTRTRATATKSTAKKATAKKATAKKATAKKATAKKATAKKATAKKATAKKSSARKAAATPAPATRATTKKASGSGRSTRSGRTSSSTSSGAGSGSGPTAGPSGSTSGSATGAEGP